MPQSPSSSSSSEAERDAIYDQIEKVLLSHRLSYTYEDEDSAMPLLDMLCASGGSDVSTGKEEIRLICDAIYNEVLAPFIARATPPSLPIDFKQASELLAMFGGEAGMVSLQIGGGHSGRGLYAHASSYPEEGAVFLGVADEEAVPSAAPKQASGQGGWLPIALAPKNTPVRLYAEGGGFYDEDFNPSGSVEGQWTDGAWCGAFWDPVHDTWFRRDDIVPTHFQYLPNPPSPHPEEGALLLGGDEGGKAMGGAA